MASPALHAALAVVRTRLRAELDEQLSSVEAACTAAIAEAHVAAHAAADERWTAKLQSLEAETAARIGAAAAAPAVAPVAPPSGDPAPVLRKLAEALSGFNAAASLSTTLDHLAAAARLIAARTAVYVVNGAALERWATSGFETGREPDARIELADAGALGQVVQFGQGTATDPGSAPRFAPATPGAIAPLMVGGRCVAVLYADGSDIETVQHTIEILAQHASSCLSRLTAEALARTAPAPGSGAAAPVHDDTTGARRYARLLVSEIKLYNEAAVRVGRERRDLLTRLRPDIDRARRLYEERVPQTVASRDRLFQQELVHTLAEGDSALLGDPD